MRQPVLFLGHGSPMNALDDNPFRQSWQHLGRRLPRPRAILVVSAHWETDDVAVSSAIKPETIHDFGGFPPALHAVRYPAAGDPALARRVAELLAPEPVRLDAHRGLDHGSWGVLLPMYPAADIPVVQLSLARDKPGAWHLALARRLTPLRDDGVLIIASGDMVHNLRLLRWPLDKAEPWALHAQNQFNDWLLGNQQEALAEPLAAGTDFALAIPTPEHYWPMLYALALRQPDDRLSLFNDVVLGSLSMTSFLVTPPGLSPESVLP